MNKFQISRDSQALYITAVAKDPLPVFQSDAIKLVTCQAINEARKSGEFLLFAYVIMPDHLHLLTDGPKTSADVLRRVKGLTARRVIDYLREHDFQSSLPLYQAAEPRSRFRPGENLAPRPFAIASASHSPAFVCRERPHQRV